MAHIIAVMDDTLHARTRSSSSQEELRSQRQAGVNQQRRMAQPRPNGAGSEIDAAPARMDRVNALRAAIADGSYAVSAPDLADKILHTMLKR